MTHEHSHTEEHSADCCCRAVCALVAALSTVHEHKCHCENDPDAVACCEATLGHVMAAIDEEMKCLKATCCQ